MESRQNLQNCSQLPTSKLQLCLRGGTAVVGKVVRTPAIELFVYNLRLMGTDRAKRKASSLALLLKKCRNTAVMPSGNRQGDSF
ncbi:unnamed protein product [Arabis nemorensis]|uniref:Uncharacterized protein n=1 Tax=Arabis nemorensis TaxID=586526 RepID=A0A565BLL5_9BRAS|nr:unnamed protein product [Arabis nemorensis]